MSYNYQDAPRESQQEYFGKIHTDNKETLQNALKRIKELEQENARLTTNEKTLLAERKIIAKENAELKKEYSDNLSLKDEELMCLETEFNTYKSKAKELLEEFCSYYMCDCDATREDKTYEAFEELKEEAEAFLKEIGK